MNIRDLINAYSDMKAALSAPELRTYMDEVPKRLNIPYKAYQQMKESAPRTKELTDLIGHYTGVHPKDIGIPETLISIDRDELRNYVHDNYGFDLDNLTPDTQQSYAEELAAGGAGTLEHLKSAIRDYGGSDYRQINKVFRDPFGPSMDNYITDQARVMLDAFKPTKNDMVVYRGLPRGTTSSKLSQMDIRGELNELGNKSFMSTTLDPAVIKHFTDTSDRNNNFRIMVPAGTPVLPVHGGYGAHSVFSPELEYLLPPDSRYARLPRTMDTDYTDLVLTRPGQMKEPAYVPDSPGVGWLAGLAPFGLLDKYQGDQQ